MAADPKRVKEVFMAVADVPSAERAAFLDRQCGDDPDLRQRVEMLLKAHEEPVSFLKQPAENGTIAYRPGHGLTVGQTFAGRFKLREELGEGGMGVVFVADQTEPVQRRVALKVIRGGADSGRVLARFEQERQALAMMDHPNIAKVLDAGISESGQPYFVMELIKGVPLTEYCDEAKLATRERLELFMPVCQAVQHAHQKGIIHRDLKPSNILVGLYDGKPVPKVIDFGVAKATGPRLSENTVYTEVGSVIGTFEYMSPEQAELNNLDIDTRSDIYALGVILYELLTGTVPFSRKELQATGFVEMLRIIKEKEPPKPSTRLSQTRELPIVAARRHTEPAKLCRLLRGDLDWITMKALEKDRSRRYETANGFAMDIQRYLGSEAVLAVPPSAGYRLRKFARKYRAALTVSAAFALLLVVGVVASTWQAVRATQAERVAEYERDRAKAEKANTQAALDFIQADVLYQASPDREPDRDLKVRTLLDRLAERLERRFDQPPPVEAAIRQTVGTVYKDLGEYAKARRHLERALDLQRRELGDMHTDTLVTMKRLASVYLSIRHDQAEPLLTRVQQQLVRVLGADHPDSLDATRNLAFYYWRERNFAVAERLMERVLQGRRAAQGELHPYTLLTMGYLAVIYAEGGRYEQAEALAAQALDQAERTLGNDHLDTTYARVNLALVYSRQDKFAPAEALYLRAIEAERRLLGDQHPYTLGDIRNLAYLYEQQGRYAAAASLITEALEGLRKVYGPKDDRVAFALAMLGHNLLVQQQHADAERVLRECLAIRKELMPATAPFFNAQSMLGGSLAEQKKYVEAEQLLLAGYAGLKNTLTQPAANAGPAGSVNALGRRFEPLEKNVPEGRWHRRLAEALDRLVRLYDAWGKPDEAAKWRAERTAYGPAPSQSDPGKK